ncbi:MAG: hypothetical protein ACI8VC_001799 [Candidatus Endobugula sp.]|jgi:hypothetical protein
MHKPHVRIFMGPTEIAGQYRNLALAMLEQGVDCNYYTFYQNEFNYGGDIGSSKIPAWMRKIHTFGKKGSVIRRISSVGIFELLRVIFFAIHFHKYDVFYFGFGASLLRWNIDLPILRMFNKKIIANLSHGSDMTPSYLNGALMDADMTMPSTRKLVKSTFAMRRRLRRFERNANVIIGSPLSSSFLSHKPYVDIIRLGRTCQAQNKPSIEHLGGSNVLPEDGVVDLKDTSKTFHFMHIPSHSPGKGTSVIREAMNKIVVEYPFVKYTELSGLSNREVLSSLADADLLIDQVYSDLPLSGIGMEAFVMGVPVLICGYGLSGLKSKYSPNIFPPTIISHPDELAERLRLLIEQPTALNEAKRNSANFVETIWSKQEVVKRYFQLFTCSDFPVDWWHDPKNYIYIHGYGLSEQRIKCILKDVLCTYGKSELCLSHRPDLENAISTFVR